MRRFTIRSTYADLHTDTSDHTAFRLQLEQMREHFALGRTAQFGSAAEYSALMIACVPAGPADQRFQDRPLTLLPLVQKRLHQVARLTQRRSVAGQVQIVVAVEQAAAGSRNSPACCRRAG